MCLSSAIEIAIFPPVSFISSIQDSASGVRRELEALLNLAILVFTMSPNMNSSFPIPPMPSCTLVPQAPLISSLSDNVLAVILPTIVYAIGGGFFHLLDTYNLFHDYRIHPSEEELKRNHVTKWQCLKTVVRYHIIQISIGLALSYGNGPTMVGDESCRVHHAAGMIRRARNIFPLVLSTLGIDAKRLASATESTSAGLAQVLAGDALSSEKASQGIGWSSVELFLAELLVFFAVPAFQYLVALTVVDTWIYFTHRLCHINKTLYRKFPLLKTPVDTHLYKRSLITPQVLSTPNTTGSTSPTHTAPYMPTGSRLCSSTYSASSSRGR